MKTRSQAVARMDDRTTSKQTI